MRFLLWLMGKEQKRISTSEWIKGMKKLGLGCK